MNEINGSGMIVNNGHLNQLNKRDCRRNKIRIYSFFKRYNDRKILNLTKNLANKRLSNFF
jgi:hypothetical protein